MMTKPVTTIRMGAAHYDITVVKPDGSPIELDLSKARWRDKSAMAAHLCEAYGITGPRPSSKSNRKKQRPHHHGKHKQGHQPAGQLSGKEPIRPHEADNGAPKRSRRRRTPRSVSASGLTAN